MRRPRMPENALRPGVVPAPLDPPPERTHRRRPRGGAPLRPGPQRLLLVCCVIGGGGALGSLLLVSPLPIAGALGLMLVVTAFYEPRVASLVVLTSWLGPFAVALLTRRIAGMALGPGDVFLWVGLAGVVVRYLVRTPVIRFGAGPLFSGVVLAYFAVVLLAATIGVGMGNRLGTASDAILPTSAILSYFLFREAYRGRPRTFAQDVFVLSGVLGLTLIATTALGLAETLGTVVDSVYTRGVEDNTLRIDAPSQRLAIFGILLFAVGAAPHRGWARRYRWVLVAGLVGATAMSLTRSTWVPLILLVIVLPALVAPDRILRRLSTRSAVALLVGVLGIGLASSGAMGEWAQGVASRFTSAAASDVAQDDSYQQRLVENEAAARQIEAHPVLGIGFPRAYGVYVPYNDPLTEVTYFAPRVFIHNSYIGVQMWLGIPGVLTLLAYTAVLVATTWDVMIRRRFDPRAPAAALATIAVIAATSTFQTHLMYAPAHALLAVAMALIDVSYQARSRLTPGEWQLGTARAGREAWRAHTRRGR